MIPCSVVSLFISWNIALMVNEETVLDCTSVAEKQVTVFTEPYSGSALLSVFRAVMTPVNCCQNRDGGTCGASHC